MIIDNEQTIKEKAAKLINESLEDIDNGAKPIDGNDFFNKLKNKYDNEEK